jgi:hypothetical protein
MRFAVFVVLLVMTTPSEASKSCMTKTEARQHFGSVHIYWHGKDHCWDATPTRRHHRIHNVQENRKDQPIGNVQQKLDEPKNFDEPKWHEAMSEMLLDAEPVQTPWVDRWVDIEPPQLPIVARWVDIVQVPPPSIIEPEPMVTPRSIVTVIIAITMTLATVEVLFGGMISKRPATRNTIASIVQWCSRRQMSTPSCDVQREPIMKPPNAAPWLRSS